MLAEIPYELNMPKALAEGKLAVRSYPESPSSTAFVELSRDVAQLLDKKLVDYHVKK